MFKQLISRTVIGAGDAGPQDDATRLGHMKAAYARWRTTQDVGAVMAALDRLSDRRLAMIGIRRDGLYDAVTEMMERVEEEQRIADEVFALLDKAPSRGERPDPAQAETGAIEARDAEERAAA